MSATELQSSTQLLTDLKDAIEKNLSSQVASTLKAHLEAAEKNAEKLKSMTDACQALTTEKSNLLSQVLSLQEELAAHEALKARTEKVEAAERNLRIKELEITLEAEKRISANSLDILSKLARNTEVRRGFFGTENVAVPGGSGSSGFVAQYPLNKTEVSEPT